MFLTAGAHPGKRLYAPANGLNQSPHHTSLAQPDATGIDVPRSASHARDPSASRGRGPELFNMNTSTLQTQQAEQPLSARSQSTAGITRSPAGLNNGGLERHNSVTHGHFHQASKVQAPYQHSRNASFVNSPATSPLSPHQLTRSASINLGITPELSGHKTFHHGPSDLRSSDSLSSTPNGSLHTSSTANLTSDRDATDAANVMLTQKRVDRTHSSKPRRSHSHQRSHSRQQHHQEQKTVSEYALHHLFNSVSYKRCRTDID